MGHTNRTQVLEGEVVGGSFDIIPLCTTTTQTGCVIAYDSNAADVPTFPQFSLPAFPPNARACVNPASIEGGAGTLGAYVFPRSSWNLGPYFPDGVDTEWVSYPNIYRSSPCFSTLTSMSFWSLWHHCHRASSDCKEPLTYLILIGDGLHKHLKHRTDLRELAIHVGDL